MAVVWKVLARRFLFACVCTGMCIEGCHQKDASITIEFWTLQLRPTFDPYFQTLISSYERRHRGITIRWVDVPYDAAVQKLLAASAAGNAPDVVNLSSDFLSKFSGMNALHDLTPLVPADSLSRFLPSAMDACTIQGKIVGLPWYLNTYVLIYNKKLISAAGFTPRDIPRTYSELVTFIGKYKHRTGRFALFWNIGKDSYLPTMLESEGVPMTDSGITEARFNSPKGLRLISAWIDAYRHGYLPRESIISPGSMIIEPYQSGQVAMVLTGPVFLERVKENAPSIYETTDVAPTPVGETGKHDLATMALSVMTSSAHPEKAVDFILFVLNRENQIAFSSIETTYPSLTCALEDSFFTTEDGTLKTKGRIVGAKELPTARRLSKHKEHPSYVLLRDLFEEAIQNACLGKVSTEEALGNAAREWNKILKKDRN